MAGSQIKHDILGRVKFLYGLFIVAGLAIVGRILYLQYGPESAELAAAAADNAYKMETIEASRGDILAHDGRLLSTSIPFYDIRMDFAAQGLADSTFNKYVDSLSVCMAGFFGDKSAKAYKTMFEQARNDRSRNRYKRVAPRRVTYPEWKVISQFPIFRLGRNKGGVITEQIDKRVMPYGTLARRTIGSINEEGVKVGIERSFDEQLRGTDGVTLKEKVSGNFWIPVSDEANTDPVNGIDVVTTLDVDIQDVAETCLKQQLEECNADWGTVVLMEVATGDIRAMANITRKKPGRYREEFNYAAGMLLEPGSTFKLATLIALLEDGGMDLNSMVDCEGGHAMVNGVSITDSHREGVISLKRVFEVSSNIGFAKSVVKHYSAKPQRYMDFLRHLGFDKPLDMQLADEAMPFVPDPANDTHRRRGQWSIQTLPKIAYGYGIEITPMHTLLLYNAVANGGRMVRPRLVRELRQYGLTVEEYPVETVTEKICSQKTIDRVRESLQAVVDDGTGKRLKNPYYSVAAKTGTAQIPLSKIRRGARGYTDASGGRHYLATLVGYFPADKPRYSMIVAVKTYHGPSNRNSYYAASLAAPIFREIADKVYARHSSWQQTVSETCGVRRSESVEMKGGSAKALRTVARELGLPLDIGRREAGWGAVERPDSLRATFRAASFYADSVPSVLGMGLKDALYLLECHGLKVSASGKGRVVRQIPAAGSPLHPGGTVGLLLEPLIDEHKNEKQ